MKTSSNEVLMIKGVISELSPEQRDKCKEFAKLINDASVGYEDCMMLTIALIGAQLASEEDPQL